jgi:hypothetical protein
MNSSYETVAASQTDQILGPSAGEHAGDFLDTLIIVPATTGAGAVQIQDGGGTEITVFPGGVGSLTELKPIVVRLAIYSRAGSWKVTTGANVSVIAIGNFT